MHEIKPQPKLLVESSYPGEGIWEYGGEVYGDDSQMRDHLFHNVYGNYLANGVDNDQEAEPVVIDYVWYWEISDA